MIRHSVSNEQRLNFIKRIMKEKNITLDNLACSFCTDKGNMSKKLRGITGLQIDDIPVYADVLGVP